MRWLLVLVALLMAEALRRLPALRAASCAREDFAQAVDRAGRRPAPAQYRQCTPRLRAKLRELKEARGWPDAGFEEKAYEALQDERMAALDLQANDLLAKLDHARHRRSGRRARLRQAAGADGDQPRAAGDREGEDRLHAGQDRPDDAAAPPLPRPSPKEQDARATASAPPPHTRAPNAAGASAGRRQLVDQDGAACRDRELASDRIAPATCPGAPARPSAPVPSSAAPGRRLPDDEGYTIDEIMAASAGFFGKVSANLGAVIEHLFKNSGRPTGYILGTEGGGAFLAGVRYGKGTLYLRAGSTQKIYWHGPSLGTDVGADGSKTLFLIYRLKSPEDIYSASPASTARPIWSAASAPRSSPTATSSWRRSARAWACGSAPTSATSASRPVDVEPLLTRET